MKSEKEIRKELDRLQLLKSEYLSDIETKDSELRIRVDGEIDILEWILEEN